MKLFLWPGVKSFEWKVIICRNLSGTSKIYKFVENFIHYLDFENKHLTVPKEFEIPFMVLWNSNLNKGAIIKKDCKIVASSPVSNQFQLFFRKEKCNIYFCLYF